MPSVDYRSLAGDVLEKVGGEANVASLTHCATRLRFRLKDTAKADKQAVERIPGVITVMEAGGQFQVVVGNNVSIAYAEIGHTTFRSHLTRVRMNAAAELLARGSLTVREVAQRVGYRQPAQFAKAFRRHHGLSPSTYRSRRRMAVAGQPPIRAAA